MPMMKSPYDQQIISLTGHSPVFKANVPTAVPDNKKLIEECLARGCALTDEEPVVEVVAPEEKSDNAAEGSEVGFEDALNKALMIILTRNDPTDFKADMMPKVFRVAAEMSPDLRRPTATEVANAYTALQENVDLAE